MALQETGAITSAVTIEDRKPIGFLDFAQILWRNRLTILLVAVPLAIPGVVGVKLLPATYEATADIVVGAEDRILEKATAPSNFAEEVQALADETRFIQSREVIGRTADLLGLQEYPEFDPEQVPAWRTAMQRVIETIRTAVAAGGSGQETQGEGLDARNRLINQVIEQLDVDAPMLSRVIKITFSSSDPELSAKVANTIASEYIAREQEREQAKWQEASEWLASRLERMRTELDETEQRLAEYRKENAVFGGLDPQVIAGELSDLNERLSVARADRKQIESRLAQLRSLLSSSSTDAAASVLDSARFDEIREEIGRLQRTQEQLSKTFGENHPQMVELAGQLRAAESELPTEATRQVDALRYQAAAAAERVRSLEEDRRRLEDSAVKRDFATVDLQRLERDAATARTLYEQVLQRYKETLDLSEDTEKAYILNQAVRPTIPSWPPRKLLYLAALFCATAGGATAALLRGAISSGFRTDDEARAALSLRIYGLVPRADPRRAVPISDLVVAQPNSLYSEAIRMVNASLLDHGTNAKVCLVTSSVPAEGKTTLCACLARSAALSGKRVLVMDCDLRCPALAPAVNYNWLQIDRGLTEHLQDPKAAKLLLLHDNETGLHVLPAGQGTDFSEPLLRSTQLSGIIERARARYDVILIDAPPVMPLVDAIILARKADMVLIAVQWSKTPGYIVKRALARLQEAATGASFGAVLTQVDVRWQRRNDREYKYLHKHYGRRYYLQDRNG